MPRFGYSVRHKAAPTGNQAEASFGVLMKTAVLFLALCATLAGVVAADRGTSIEGPRLLFREDWKETPPATLITQDHVANPDLILICRGPAEAKLRKSHHDKPADDPYYVWSGEADATWALSLRQRTQLMDLSGPAKVRWRAKQSGFRQLRVIVRLADGRWLVSDQSDDASDDWRLREFDLGQIRWRTLDIEKVVEGKWEPNPDLRRVEEIGCTDLMPGGRTQASSRLDWIEVHGRPIPRTNEP